jgi:type IV pilus assembly protein PilM
MAAKDRILALDLGTQTVGIAEFRTGQSGGLVLTNYRNSELLADPAADATRQAQSKIAVGEMVAGLGYKGANVNYAVASQAVFTRFVKLPSVGEEQVDQIVTFEAQQNVPYPINEVVWDYQLVDSGDAAQVEVVIVAIKSDLLDEINDSVESSGLKAGVVDVAPMAIYNAFRYNYSDVGGCSLIIDIGARTTNLIFIEPKKIFSRSIPTGGNTITAAIAKDFQEPFGAAEERKKRDGFVSLGGSYAEPDDPEVARVSKMIRNTMTKLHAEISRSISFYRSQQNGSQPQRVYLAGGSASLPYMREFFHEKFQLPVEFFNPLRNVAVGGNLNLEEIGRQAHTMGEMVGLALRQTSSCPMELNLRPASVVRRHVLAERRPALVTAGVCLLLALAGFWLYYSRATAVTNDVLAQIEPRTNELKGFEGQMNTIRSGMKAQQETAAPLLNSVRERDYWATVINDINARLPKDFVWITSFEPQKVEEAAAPTGPAAKRPASAAKKTDEPKPTAVINIRGLYLENPQGPGVVDQFMTKLDESELYAVEKDPTTIVRETPNTDAWAYAYAFRLNLKNPIDLPAPAKR